MSRIAIAGFLHESNTFLGTPTQYENFVSASLTTGPAVIERWTHAHHELGGMVDTILASDSTLVPLLATFAIPSGTITADAFERIWEELLDAIAISGRIDGLLIALHGATVSEAFPDADGEILRRLREHFGPDIPIINTLDLHANISEAMVAHATATVAYRSNPHLDQRERGIEAAQLMLATLAGTVKPVQAVAMPPLIIPIASQHTAAGPARELYGALEEVLAWPGIVSASIALGFYYADVAEMGASALAVADGDAALARRAATYLADAMWQRREALCATLPTPEHAVRIAAESPGPVVLMDVGDNVGAGSPANSTVLFAEVLRQQVNNALVILHDPAAVAACAAEGIGAAVTLNVGEPAISITGRVRTLSDGRFVERQVRHGGWGNYNQGPTAVVETAEQHTIVLTTLRMAPMSLEQILSLGITPTAKQILIVKGVVAPRAAYAPVAASILLVDTPGVTSNNPAHFQYAHCRPNLFPLCPNPQF